MSARLAGARALIIAIAAMLVSACTYTVGYRPDFVPSPAGVARTPGTAAVAMSPGVEQAVTDIRPSSFTGGASTLSLPVGQIVKQIAITVFGASFEGGVISVSDVAGTSGRDYVIEPTVTALSYKYDQLSNLGFAVTPRVSVSIQIRIRSAEGALILDRVYHQDHAQGTYLASVQPHERVNRALHEAIQMIMVNAANDFAAARGIPAPTS